MAISFQAQAKQATVPGAWYAHLHIASYIQQNADAAAQGAFSQLFSHTCPVVFVLRE